MTSRDINRSLRTACALVAALGLVASCSSEASTSAGSTTTVAADSSSTTAAGASTLPTATSSVAVTPSTSSAGTTTVAPEPLELRSDGLGPFRFDDFPSDVIPAVAAQLGEPARNDLLFYEDLSDFAAFGVYTSFDGPYYYSLRYPVGRTTCWTGEFCLEFGGASETTLAFIGWWYTGPPHMMASSSNLTIGAQWGDFPSMIVFATCYTTGGGTHHDIQLQLETASPWDWLVSDGAGGFVENLPDPEFTRVSYMSAGERPFQPVGDC